MGAAFGSVCAGIRRTRLAFPPKNPVPSSLRSTLSRFALLALSCAFLTFGTLGCTHQTILNTDVEDTDLNRKVIEYCELYRHAVEQRNTARLLEMAHPSYYEDGGNVDASDDLDYAGLRDYLNDEIHYRQVSDGRKDTVLVDYTYSASYKIPTTRGDVWRRRVADNRLTLLREGDNFRILAGM